MDVLKELGIQPVNPGTTTGSGWWSSTTDAGTLESINPATGTPIAKINLCSPGDVEQVVKEAERAFEAWRMVPAPKRGELVRLVG